MIYKHLWHRIKYRKQLKQGFKLIGGKRQKFVIVNDRAFIVNGQDPMVRVDLSTSKVEQFAPNGEKLAYTYKVTKWTPDD